MFDVFSIISKGFSGLTASKEAGIPANTQVGQTVPNTPNMITNAGGNGAAYAATDTPSISLLSGTGKNGSNLSSGGAAATHYGDVVGKKSFNVTGSQDWLNQAQAAFKDAQKGQGDLQPVQAAPLHHMQLNTSGANEAQAKAPAWSLAGAIGQSKQISSADFKNQYGG